MPCDAAGSIGACTAHSLTDAHCGAHRRGPTLGAFNPQFTERCVVARTVARTRGSSMCTHTTRTRTHAHACRCGRTHAGSSRNACVRGCCTVCFSCARTTGASTVSSGASQRAAQLVPCGRRRTACHRIRTAIGRRCRSCHSTDNRTTLWITHEWAAGSDSQFTRMRHGIQGCTCRTPHATHSTQRTELRRSSQVLCAQRGDDHPALRV